MWNTKQRYGYTTDQIDFKDVDILQKQAEKLKSRKMKEG